MQSEDENWICPSFNSYSLTKSAEIAARVAGEAAGNDQFSHENLPRISENEEDDFEFCLVRNDKLEVSGDKINLSGEPVFPIFNRDIVNDFDSEKINSIKVPLSRLFMEDEEASSSTCSSEADEMESIPPGTYCVWKPKPVEASPSGCNKSKSTGFGSKRWRLRDLLLRRSNSEGKDSFVFLTPKRKQENIIQIDKNSKAGIFKKSTATTATQSPPPANRSLTRRDETPKRCSKGKGEMVKRKSYLPYRQNLVGFFTTVNSLGRNLSPR